MIIIAYKRLGWAFDIFYCRSSNLLVDNAKYCKQSIDPHFLTTSNNQRVPQKEAEITYKGFLKVSKYVLYGALFLPPPLVVAFELTVQAVSRS